MGLRRMGFPAHRMKCVNSLERLFYGVRRLSSGAVCGKIVDSPHPDPSPDFGRGVGVGLSTILPQIAPLDNLRIP